MGAIKLLAAALLVTVQQADRTTPARSCGWPLRPWRKTAPSAFVGAPSLLAPGDVRLRALYHCARNRSAWVPHRRPVRLLEQES